MEKNTCGRETPVFGDAVHLFSFPSWGVCGKTLTAMRAILTGWGSTALPVIWISKGEDGIVYWLESTPETLGKYPFPFRLMIGYLLEGNRITVKWRVENLGQLDMYFQIGAHPAFNFPGFDASVDERGFFAFDSKEELRYIVPVEKGCVSPELHTLERDVDGLMKIDTHTFDCDTYIFQDAQLKKVTLLDRKKQPHISLEFDTPLVALWSPAKAHPDCPFVCIEPWYGRCDAVGFDGELKDREWIQKLGSKEVFDVSYSIIIEK